MAHRKGKEGKRARKQQPCWMLEWETHWEAVRYGQRSVPIAMWAKLRLILLMCAEKEAIAL